MAGVRDVARGRWTRRIVERDQSEWIEVAGATPVIIDRGLFDAAQKILDDPSRRPQTAPSDVYLLRGRISCRECGARMVGHASNRGRYRYYRCPNGSSGPGETSCGSKYIRIERLEGAVKTALTDLLASPDRLLGEAKRLAGRQPQDEDLEKGSLTRFPGHLGLRRRCRPGRSPGCPEPTHPSSAVVLSNWPGCGRNRSRGSLRTWGSPGRACTAGCGRPMSTRATERA